MRSIEHSDVIAGFSLAAAAALGATGCASEAAPTQEPTVSASARQPGEMTLRQEIVGAYEGCKIVGVDNIGRPSIARRPSRDVRVNYSVILDAQLDTDVLKNPGPDFYRDSPKMRVVNSPYAPPKAKWRDSRLADSDYTRGISDRQNAKPKIVDTSVSLLGLQNLPKHVSKEIVEVSLPVYGYEDKGGETSTVTAERVCGQLAIRGSLGGVESIEIFSTPHTPEEAPVRVSTEPWSHTS